MNIDSPSTPNRHRHRRRLLAALVFAFALLTVACGGDPVPISVPANAESASQSAAQAGAPIASQADSDLGPILVDSAGFSLYGFTDDIDGQSTCDGGCAGAWPPVLVPSTQLPADLDPSLFSVIQRGDGTNQLKVGKWPLYLFAGDTAPGQTTGHLSGDVWFLAAPDGSLIGVEAPAPAAAAPTAEAASVEAPTVEAAPVALASVGSSALGDILVSGAGLTLYGFTNDVDGVPTCEGGCAEAWPPILVTDQVLPADLDPSVFSIVTRPDGSSQLKAGKWPLYLFAGDTAPGQTTGHLSGDVWFAASPTGGLIDAPAPAPAAPADDDEPNDAADGYGSAAAEPAQAAAATPVPAPATAVPATPVPAPATAVPATPVPATPVPAPATAVPAPVAPAPTPTPYSYSSDY